MLKETTKNLSAKCTNYFTFRERSNTYSSSISGLERELTVGLFSIINKMLMLCSWIHLCALAGTSIGLIRGDEFVEFRLDSDNDTFY